MVGESQIVLLCGRLPSGHEVRGQGYSISPEGNTDIIIMLGIEW